MHNLMNLRLALPSGSLEAYIEAVNRIPMVSAEEEYALAIRYREHNDLAAAKALVLSHLRFVVKIARGYLGYGLPLGDLIQEGNIGLMKAVKRFDPKIGVRLVSFAVHWIRAEIHEFILRNWRIVKIATTKAQRKLFFNLRSAKKHLGWLSRDEAESVAQDLGVSAREVYEMEERLSSSDTAFDGAPGVDADEQPAAPVAYLEDKRDGPEIELEHAQLEARNQELLARGLARLDDRSRAIIEQRWLKENRATLHDLAAEYGISAERIRQLEQAALKKLREAMAA
jgi:RNA polymerase sigma-32 factor